MADKEATVYIIDVGKSMKKRNQGREESDLDWAMRYVWDKITTTVATGRKTATIGVVGLKTDDTKVPLEDSEGYENITVMQDLGQMLMPDIRRLRDEIKPSITDEGDAISALVVAIQMINVFTKKLKYRRKIYLITNGRGLMSSDDLGDIASKLKSDNIELVVLGVDFDDAEYGFKEEDKNEAKAENESLLRSLVEGCDGVFGTLAQAIEELDTPRLKIVRGIPSFRGDLRLGDPTQYDTALRIQVERYYRTYVAKPPSASSFVVSSAKDQSQPSASMQSPDPSKDADASLTAVRNVRTYHVDDPTAVGGKRELEREELAKGYEYGRTAVHISESDENITKLETTAVLDLIGFIQADNYDRYMNMSTSNVIIAQKTNEKAALALSSLIHALFELDCYVVARLVVKDGKSPLIVLLAPSIEPDYECLLEVQLPFFEDVRSYTFPPLDKVITTSGKEVKEHCNLPSEDLISSMSKFVDSMELIDKDDEGEILETIPFENNFSPLLHRIDQAVRWRAVNPDKPTPTLSERLTQLSNPPKEVLERAQKFLDRIMRAADVKKVPPKAKGRKRNRDVEKPLSGLDVDELLHREKRTKISPKNAIPEFKQTLATAETVDAVKEATGQMQKIIEDHIRNSFGDSNYDRVVEELGVLREELIDYEEPDLYNDFVRQLKEKILKEQLGGDRQELWWLIRRSKIGLIDKAASDRSEVTEEEAKQFLSSK